MWMDVCLGVCGYVPVCMHTDSTYIYLHLHKDTKSQSLKDLYHITMLDW